MKKYFLIIIHLILTIICSSQNENNIWDYPIKPGTENWKLLKNNSEKINACKIPDAILKSIQTKELLSICISYPLFMDVMAFSSVQSGIDKLKIDFNGINELFNRHDFKDVTIRYYEDLDLSFFDSNLSIEDKWEFSFKVMALELIMSQNEFCLNLNNVERKNLIKILLNKYNAKTDKKVFNEISKMTICFAIGRIIKSDANSVNYFTTTEVYESDFINFGSFRKVDIIPKILFKANKFIK
jgi:hypothetical protein